MKVLTPILPRGTFMRAIGSFALPSFIRICIKFLFEDFLGETPSNHTCALALT